MKILYPKEIKAILDKSVFGHERAKRTLAIAGHQQMQALFDYLNGRKPIKMNNHVLLIGETGTGKTALARALADALGLHVSINSCTGLTSYGWAGGYYVSDILSNHYETAPSAEEAQRGILFLDEIDKIGARGQGTHLDHYYKIQGNLLPALEGTPVTEPAEAKKRNGQIFETEGMLIIAAGAFSGARDVQKSGTIGFLQSEDTGSSDDSSDRQMVTDYGFLEELIGRFRAISRLDTLEAPEFRQILTLGPESIVSRYMEHFKRMGAELRLTSTALEAIAKRAVPLGMGVRGLESVLKDVLTDYMYDIDEVEGNELVITKRVVDEKLK